MQADNEGYITLPNGILIQWGFRNGKESRYIVFPKPFTELFGVWGTADFNSSTNDGLVIVCATARYKQTDNTQSIYMAVRYRSGSSGMASEDYQWIAIGKA